MGGVPEGTALVVDTHAHLDTDAFAADLPEVLSRAQDAGLERILAVGSDLASSRRAIEIAQQFPFVRATAGVHPHDVARFDQESAGVEALLDSGNVIAVGEIGLDYLRGGDRAAQQRAFRAQLAWAAARGMPVSVHNRDADEDVLAALAEFPVTAVLHCFSGSWQTAERALGAGHYLSFAGNITFPKAGALRDVVARAPLNRILIETDAPVLAPQGHRGRRNEPSWILETARCMAELRDLPLSDLLSHLDRNADQVFHWRPT